MGAMLSPPPIETIRQQFNGGVSMSFFSCMTSSTVPSVQIT